MDRYLQAGANPDDVARGFPMIARATQNGHAEVVRVLAQAGANLEATTNYGATALHIAEEARRLGISTTRLARGLPSGSQIEYASRAVLADAITERRPID